MVLRQNAVKSDIGYMVARPKATAGGEERRDGGFKKGAEEEMTCRGERAGGSMSPLTRIGV